MACQTRTSAVARTVLAALATVASAATTFIALLKLETTLQRLELRSRRARLEALNAARTQGQVLPQSANYRLLGGTGLCVSGDMSRRRSRRPCDPSCRRWRVAYRLRQLRRWSLPLTPGAQAGKLDEVLPRTARARAAGAPSAV